jgi:hypothetical protein
VAERHVRLKAPIGVVGVNYGGEVYRVIEGHVVVPVMAEAVLTRPDFGFSFPDEPKLLNAEPMRTLHVKKR